MEKEDQPSPHQEVRMIGQDIHRTELHIYAARQAVSALRTQEPVDRAAIGVQIEIAREAHHVRHEQEHRLWAAKEAAAALRSQWPFHGVSTW